MENDNRIVRIFLDDDPTPIAEYQPPVKMMLDTTKLTDGRHKLRIVARSTNGHEGIKEVPFIVRNGPSITVVGLSDNDVVDHHLPITINAYGSERPDMFIVTGSETPAAIPAWVWVLVIAFIAWGLFFLIRHLTPANYAFLLPLGFIRRFAGREDTKKKYPVVMNDIASLEDIKKLVDEFYGKVRNDALIGPVFKEAIGDRWDRHLDIMYRFWQTILLEQGQTYFGNPFMKHAPLPIDRTHFEKWLSLWKETLYEHFQGPVTDEAMVRAEKMAYIFMVKLEAIHKEGGKPVF